MKTVKAYKLAKPDGYDFHTGKTINYRENVGKIVKCPNANPELGVCSGGVIHASKNPNDCFIGAKIPCSAYQVEGKPACGDAKKWGFTELLIEREILDLDLLFGWKYSEVLNPFNPLAKKHKPTKTDIKLLKVWASVHSSVHSSVPDSVHASVHDSVFASVHVSVHDSVWDSVHASVWASVYASVWASVWDSVHASVWASVYASVWASVWAYFGSLFPNIKEWKYLEYKAGTYPYQSGADLWRRSLVPSFDGKVWRLHSGEQADIVFEITKEDLLSLK